MAFKDLVFYHIYPLGFCGAEAHTGEINQITHRLQKITEHIPKLKSLGINALYIGPLFHSLTHGYDTIDYKVVDRRLGQEEDLKLLVKVCHQHGIKVMFDCVFNHVSRQFFAFQDLLEKRMNSHYLSWFIGIDFNKDNPYNDGFDYETWDGHYHLVKLNLSHHEVKNYLIEVARFWIETYEIDGLRMDAADVMDLGFLRDLSYACKEIKKDFFLFGEIVKGDYLSLIQDGHLDGVTNYECYKGLYSSLNDSNYFEIAYSLNRQFGEGGLFKDKGVLYNFVDNHDVNRVASVLNKEAHLYPLYILLFTMPGVPSIYYSSEYGQKGIKMNGSDRQLRTVFLEGNKDHPLYKTICLLGDIRSKTKSLRYGYYQQINVMSEQLAFIRKYEDEEVIILLNASNNVAKINLPNNFKGKYKDLLNQEIVELAGPVDIYPNWGRILFKE